MHQPRQQHRSGMKRRILQVESLESRNLLSGLIQNLLPLPTAALMSVTRILESPAAGDTGTTSLVGSVVSTLDHTVSPVIDTTAAVLDVASQPLTPVTTSVEPVVTAVSPVLEPVADSTGGAVVLDNILGGSAGAVPEIVSAVITPEASPVTGTPTAVLPPATEVAPPQAPLAIGEPTAPAETGAGEPGAVPVPLAGGTDAPLGATTNTTPTLPTSGTPAINNQVLPAVVFAEAAPGTETPNTDAIRPAVVVPAADQDGAIQVAAAAVDAALPVDAAFLVQTAAPAESTALDVEALPFGLIEQIALPGLEGIGLATRDLFNQAGGWAEDAGSFAPWLTALVVAALAYEVARRDLRRQRAGQIVAAGPGLTGFSPIEEL